MKRHSMKKWKLKQINDCWGDYGRDSSLLYYWGFWDSLLCVICGTELEVLFPGNDPLICCEHEMIPREEYYKERMSR